MLVLVLVLAQQTGWDTDHTPALDGQAGGGGPLLWLPAYIQPDRDFPTSPSVLAGWRLLLSYLPLRGRQSGFFRGFITRGKLLTTSGALGPLPDR